MGLRNPGFKQTNSPELSVGHLNAIPGLQDTAHARAEDPLQRKASALAAAKERSERGEGGTRPEAQVCRGGASGGGALSPLTPPLSVLGLLVLLSSCASISLPFDAFKSLWFPLEQSCFLLVLS